MSANHQTSAISHTQLPTGAAVVFPDTSFFQNNGKRAKLPEPAAVRKESKRPRTGVLKNKPWCVPFISQKLFVKYGPETSIAEGQTLWAIRRQLGHQVPVPEVYGWCQEGGDVFLYMQFIQGPTLNEMMDKLGHPELLDVIRQLRQIVVALRSLRQAPNESFLGDISGRQLSERIFENCERPPGPFSSVSKFNDYFIDLMWTRPGPPPTPCNHFKRPGLPDDSPVFFTHADLTPTNIVLSVSPSGRPTIAAIIDFEQAGWYPAYWEACKSLGLADPDSVWGKNLSSVFVPYGEYLDTFRWMRSAGHAI